jgi:hypothetical protein
MLVLILAVPGWAAPSAWVTVPTMDVLAPDEFSADCSSEGAVLVGGEDCDRWLNTQLGFSPGFEGGLDFCLSSTESVLLNVKWQCLQQDSQQPAIAVGIQGVGSGTTPQSYVVLGRSWERWNGGVGLLHSDSEVVGMIGLDYALSPSFTLIGDHLGGGEGVTSLALGWEANPHWSLTAGHIWAHDGDDRNWYLDVAYTVSLAR